MGLCTDIKGFIVLSKDNGSGGLSEEWKRKWKLPYSGSWGLGSGDLVSRFMTPISHITVPVVLFATDPASDIWVWTSQGQ